MAKSNRFTENARGRFIVGQHCITLARWSKAWGVEPGEREYALADRCLTSRSIGVPSSKRTALALMFRAQGASNGNGKAGQGEIEMCTGDTATNAYYNAQRMFGALAVTGIAARDGRPVIALTFGKPAAKAKPAKPISKRKVRQQPDEPATADDIQLATELAS